MYASASVSSAVTTACAKVNLTLDVLGRRDDGYHEIRSLVMGVDLRDRVTCSICAPPGVSLTCSDSALEGEENLAAKGLMQLARHVGREPALRIELEKVIPVAAGLGGGSSDAAAALRLGNELWNLGCTSAELADIGSRVGADVPLFFHLPSAMMGGRGECVEPVTLAWSGWVVLVSVGTAVHTAEVYRQWRRSDVTGLPTGMGHAIAVVESAEQLMPMLSNHLEPAVFRVSAVVARAHDRLNSFGVGPWRVSGAGSTLYRLFDDEETACEVAKQIKDRGIGTVTSVVAAPTGQDPVVGKEN